MCGDYHSVSGMHKDEPLQRFVNKISGGRVEPATGEVTLCGLAIETDDTTGLAVAVEPFRQGGSLRPVAPGMWTE